MKKVLNRSQSILMFIFSFLLSLQLFTVATTLYEGSKLIHFMPWYQGNGDWELIIYFTLFPAVLILSLILLVLNHWAKVLTLKTILSMFSIPFIFALQFIGYAILKFQHFNINPYTRDRIINNVFVFAIIAFTTLSLIFIITDVISLKNKFKNQ